ncbi:MAG: acyl-CoA thioesterase [Natronosporangium sp.]
MSTPPSSGPGGKPTARSRLTLSRVMGPADVNLMGTVHGGVMLRLIDEVAGVVAARHAEGAAVTAFMDEMAFLVAVHIGDVVHVHAQVNWAGTTSMEVGVRVTADRWNDSVPATHVASAYLVMVAIDQDGQPRPVPPVIPDNAENHRRFREALIRRQHRLTRRSAIVASREAGR